MTISRRLWTRTIWTIDPSITITWPIAANPLHIQFDAGLLALHASFHLRSWQVLPVFRTAVSCQSSSTLLKQSRSAVSWQELSTHEKGQMRGTYRMDLEGSTLLYNFLDGFNQKHLLGRAVVRECECLYKARWVPASIRNWSVKGISSLYECQFASCQS